MHLKKNHTHVKKVGQTSEFPFGFYWWTLKNLKNQNFENMNKNCWRYHHFTHVYQNPQSYEVQFLRYAVRNNFFVILGHFQNNTENQKNEKSTWRCHHFKLVQQKTWSYDVCLLRYGVRQTIFCYFRPVFALLPHYWPQKLKFGKNVKNTWRYYPFTHVYHKSRSYDVWFLRYKVQRTEFFVILGHFYPLTLLTTQKIKTWKNEKNSWRYYHFKHEYHKWKSYDVWFLRYGAQQTNFFLILDHFLPFYTISPANNTENQNLEKMKITPGDIIILHKCNINYNHMIYGSWDMKCTRQNFCCHLGPFFALLPP